MAGQFSKVANRLRAFHTNYEYLSLGVILTAFVLVALGNVTRWSIWFDEAFSAYLMRFNLAELTRFTALDVHPPLYYWTLKGWTTLFGTTELAFRSLSIAFAVAALIAAYFLVRQLFNRHVATIATGLAALSPLLLRFADEARMYTMVTAIVLTATWLLVRLQTKPSRAGWVVFALLLAAGMYTHYFAAFAWLALWVWRYLEKRAGNVEKFWSWPWILSHVGAVALFLPWLPIALRQFTSVQQGFWIPGISVYTPIDYLSNSWLYLTYGAANNWWSIVFWALVLLVGAVLVSGYRRLQPSWRMGYRLLAVMSLVPPLIMVVISLPPLKSTFMDRYVLYSIVCLVLLIAVSLVAARKTRPKLVAACATLLVASSIIGIGFVYYYGNYNKNSHVSIRAREAVNFAKQYGMDGQPIIASSTWIYYEASFYETPDHQVYYLDSSTDYGFGSLAMLRDSSEGKITDLAEFSQQHTNIWYIDTGEKAELEPPKESWEKIKTYSAYDYIENEYLYHATLYDTKPSAE